MESQDLDQLAEYARAVEAISKRWKPHAKQVPVGQAVFRDGIKRLMLCMGRRFGKSTVIANIVSRVALARPYSACVILCPTINSAKRIYWISGIIKNMVPAEYVESYNNTELRIYLKNGSYIECTGAEDPDRLRGTGISIYAVDEYTEHKADVLHVITPALMDKKGILIVGGTPPKVGGKHHFWDLVDESRVSNEWRYFHATTYDNPYLDKEDVDKERKGYELRGELDIFTREYMAERAHSVKHSVYGMFDRNKHVFPYAQLVQKVRSKLSHWTLMIAMDPGSASVFAVLLGAVNNHTGEVVILDELYADRVVETSIGTIWPKVQALADAVYAFDPDDESSWRVVYDEAATWARVELEDVFNVTALPTQKSLNRKSFGVSLIKDLYIKNKMFVSDRCLKFIEETESYQTNDRGEYIKERDHTLDCARYLIHGAFFTTRLSEPPTDQADIPLDERRRAFRPEEDLESLSVYQDSSYSFESLDYED